MMSCCIYSLFQILSTVGGSSSAQGGIQVSLCNTGWRIIPIQILFAHKLSSKKKYQSENDCLLNKIDVYQVTEIPRFDDYWYW